MRFTISHVNDKASGRQQPGMILVDRCDFLDTYQNEPALCRAEMGLLSRMFGGYYRAEAGWSESELDAAAVLLRAEKGCRSLVLSIQQGSSGPRVVFDAE